MVEIGTGQPLEWLAFVRRQPDFLGEALGRSIDRQAEGVGAGAEGGAKATVSNYVMTHYNALIAVKAAIEKAGKVDKEALVDALGGLSIKSPTGPVTIGKDHHATMNLFIAKTKGSDLVTVRALGEIAPESGCKPGG